MATTNGSTAIRDKILASLARYRALRIGKFPCAFWRLSSRPGLTAYVTETVAYAKILKPDVINILPGRCFDTSLLGDYQQTFKENLHFALEAFSPLGIKTVFEAVNTVDMPGFIISSSEKMLAL
ncbi:hypothetical protein BMR06_09390, partial [Methylococcaceae bacterium HT5]